MRSVDLSHVAGALHSSPGGWHPDSAWCLRSMGALPTRIPAAVTRTKKCRRLAQPMRQGKSSPGGSLQLPKRKMLVKPSGCRKRRRGGDSTKLTRTSKHDRAREFPAEHLIVENNVLFCNACRTEISVKKSIVKTHIRRKRHSDVKVRMEKEAERQVSSQSAWQAYEKKVNPIGETLLGEEKMWRLDVLMSFMKAGLAVTKIDQLRHLLEKHHPRLFCARHL